MHILIIEDEAKLAEFMRRALEEEGHQVSVEHDGASGLDRALLQTFDAIILDWLLPTMDGRTICHEIRLRSMHVPIMLVTARDSIDDRINGLDVGADDYLTKPFALGELTARIRAIGRRAHQVAPILQVGDLTLEPETRRVMRSDVEVYLTGKEYALLNYLVRNVGKTLTRSMIAEKVWDLDYDCGTNVVEVYINYLRNKIDKKHTVKLIHTIRGVGYRFESCGDSSI